jgi:hypothetical protein
MRLALNVFERLSCFARVLTVSQEQAATLDRVQAISNALSKGVKRIQNFVWMKGTQGDSSSQEACTQESESPQITEASTYSPVLVWRCCICVACCSC